MSLGTANTAPARCCATRRATTVAASERVTMDLAYSYQSQNVFRGLNGGNGLPLMSNSPNSRGSIGMRYRNDENGLGFELRSRYNEAYPVNSGVYATGFAFPIAPGQAGATATASGGPGRCSPAPAGTYALPSSRMSVRIVMQESRLPLKLK